MQYDSGTVQGQTEPVVESRKRVADVRLTRREGPLEAHRRFDRFIPLIVFGGIALVLALSVPNFLTVRNIVNLLTQSSALALLSVGMAVVLIIGGIDLSMPAVMALSGIVGAIFMRAGGNPVAAALIMVAVGSSAGLINGLAVAHLRMIPFIVTLSMQAIATGASIWATNAISVSGIPASFADTILAKVWVIPIPVIALVCVATISELLLRRSLFGRWLYSVGTNARASRVAGIDTDRVTLGSYLFSGFMSGLVAIIITARLNSAAVTMGSDNLVLDIVSGAVVGGVSIYGGAGSAIGAVIGALFMTFIGNSMNFLHVPFYLTLMIKGCLIIGVVAVDSIRKR